jgi:8-oxo-dGTP pyrophosphatase MutT (NUDIX family)
MEILKENKSQKNFFMNNIICQTLQGYFFYFPKDKERLTLLYSQWQKNDSLENRRNFRGHITGSGFVVHQNKILLIFHKQFQIFLQPGGHYEEDESLEACARREVREETGLEVIPHIWHEKNNNIPLYIDTHPIPSSEKKNEKAHFHHDHLFLYSIKNAQEIALQREEVEGYKWISFEELKGQKESLKNFYNRAKKMHLL